MITLSKGSRINLAKEDGSTLSLVSMGLGWDVAKGFFGGGGSIDLDASALMLDANKNLLDQVWFRSPGLRSRCGNVIHSGDNRTGAGDGDDETITVKLAALSPNVQYLVFTVNSFTGQNFKDVKNANCNLYDETGKKIATFNLSEKGSHTGLIMACIYRKDGGWKVNAVGVPSNGRVAEQMINDIRDLI